VNTDNTDRPDGGPFGSRANDPKRGGDVDLFVEASSPDLMATMRCKADLGDLFDLKVDLIVGDGSRPIHRIAKQTGGRLKCVKT